jgi:hypothetical protein
MKYKDAISAFVQSDIYHMISFAQICIYNKLISTLMAYANGEEHIRKVCVYFTAVNIFTLVQK